MHKVTRRVLLGVLLAALGRAPVAAQPGPPPPPRPLPELSGFSVVPFSFGPPGARSLGMGGTFLALADDATASEANPAGLTKLSRPEVSIHGRWARSEIEALDVNAITALDALNRARTLEPELRPRSQVGNAFAGDTRARFESTESQASFVSFVKPFARTTVALSYQRAADFSGRNTFSAYDDSLLDSYRARQQLDLTLDNLGFSVAFKAGDRLSVGASLRYSRLTVAAFQDVLLSYPSDDELAQLPVGSSLQEVDALGILDQQITRQDLDDRQGELTFNAGLLLNPQGPWSLGLVYKRGGDFDIAGRNEMFSCRGLVSQGVLRCEPPGVGQPTSARFKVPDFFGAGIAWRVTERFRLAFDANHVTYSDLTIAPAPNPDAGPGVGMQFVSNRDTTSLHFGLEYVFFAGADGPPITLRAGAMKEPDHDSFRDIDSEATLGTFGLGLVLMEKLQLDAAAQFGGLTDAAILSVVYRL